MPMSLLAVIPTTLAHWIYYSSLGLSRPIYFTFIFYYAHGSINCHSYHVGPLSLLPLFLSFLSPFALLLPLIVSMSLLAVIPVMLVHWDYYLTFITYTPFSSHFPYCWVSFAIGPFVKSGHLQFFFLIESFNLWCPLLMMILYHQIKTSTSF